MRRALWAALAAGLGACGDTPSPADGGTDLGDTGTCLARGATLVVGTATSVGDPAPRALSDGDDVYLVPGPQGGQHIWVALQGRGFDGTQPRVELHAYDAADGRALGSIRVRLRFSLSPRDATLLVLAPQTLVLDDDAYCAVLGRAVRVTVDLADGAGRCMHEERVVRLADIDPTADPRDRDARTQCCTQRWTRCYPDAGVPMDASGG